MVAKALRIICLLAIISLILNNYIVVEAFSSHGPDFSINAPAGWKSEPVNEHLVRFYPTGEDIRFSIETFSGENLTLPSLVTASLNTLTKGLSDYQISSQRQTSLAGMTAQELVLNVPQGSGQSLTIDSVVCLKDNWGYRISSLGKSALVNSHQADFTQFLNSFSFSSNVTFPFKDEFNNQLSDSQWYRVRSNETGYSFSPNGYLDIQSLYGDLWGNTNNANNLLLRPAPDGDFEITTSLHFIPVSNGQQAGLLIYQNDDTYLMLARSRSTSSMINFVREEGAISDSFTIPFDSATAYLKIARVGKQYLGFAGSDGKTWKRVAIFDNTTFTNPQIGLGAFQSINGPSTKAEFDYFTLGEVHINRPPVASFLTNPSEPHAGDSISFASTSTDPDSDILKHAWYLDGAYLDKTGNSPLWTWENAPSGKHSIKLVVDDGQGGVTESTMGLDLSNGGSFPYWIFLIPLGFILAGGLGVLVIFLVRANSRSGASR
jgi:hypothetical protein